MLTVSSRLHGAYQDAKKIQFDSSSKFILFSDCHRGQGNTGDNFLPNQTLFFGALENYYKKGFTYIELGDGDELWENRNLKHIIEAHSDAFWLMSKFYRENRFHMIYGNHDIVKSKKTYRDKNCNSFYCECDKQCVPLFPNIDMTESIVLKSAENGREILLVHGHQGSFLNDTIWPFARFLVRYLWKPFELIGFIAPTKSGRAHRQKEKIEKKMAAFADKNQLLLIAGHTHRPVFPKPGGSLYFNDGSCVHPRCITGIEIENNCLSLIKWAVFTREDGSLFVGRQVLDGPVLISDYFERAEIKLPGEYYNKI